MKEGKKRVLCTNTRQAKYFSSSIFAYYLILPFLDQKYNNS